MVVHPLIHHQLWVGYFLKSEWWWREATGIYWCGAHTVNMCENVVCNSGFRSAEFICGTTAAFSPFLQHWITFKWLEWKDQSNINNRVLLAKIVGNFTLVQCKSLMFNCALNSSIDFFWSHIHIPEKSSHLLTTCILMCCISICSLSNKGSLSLCVKFRRSSSKCCLTLFRKHT